MKGYWWKLTGVIILIYVFIGGMLVPLKTGIVRVDPKAARTGEEVNLQVIGYNAHYTKAKDSLEAWLKMDDEHFLSAKAITVIDDRKLTVQFNIPPYLPVKSRVQEFALIVQNDFDGASVLPNALFVTQDSIDPDMGIRGWPDTAISGLTEKAGITFPFRNILAESIRNTYFHVPLWFAMLFLLLASVYYSVLYLNRRETNLDIKAVSYARVGVIMGVLGVLTGAIWAKHTWGAYWSWDIKQNMTAVALLIYFAYFVLRAYLEDPERKARLSAVYNIFAFATLIPLIYVIPRLTDSLHPGAGGNPAFGGEDLDNTMRLFFYPAIIGWSLIGFWMADILQRIKKIEERHLHEPLKYDYH